MVKTHPDSRIRIMSLENIRDTSDIILQSEKTDSKFSNGGGDIYLCEVVAPYHYKKESTIERLTDEIVRVNEENRTLRRRIKIAENKLKRLEI